MKPLKPALTLVAFALTFLVAATLGADAQRDNRAQPTLEAVANPDPALSERGGMAFDRRSSEGNPMFCAEGAEGKKGGRIRSWFKGLWTGIKKAVGSIRCELFTDGVIVKCEISF